MIYKSTVVVLIHIGCKVSWQYTIIKLSISCWGPGYGSWSITICQSNKCKGSFGWDTYIHMWHFQGEYGFLGEKGVTLVQALYSWSHKDTISTCMYVCLYVCMYVCMYVCIYVCLYICMYVCMYVCILTYLITYLLTHSLTHSATQPLTHPRTHSLTYFLTYLLTYLLNKMMNHLL